MSGDCKLALFCGTEPIIESSQNMQFACFDFNYFSLRGQMTRAGLKPWNNKWWMVYDFNKNEDKPNWSLLDQAEASRLLNLEKCPSIAQEELENEGSDPGRSSFAKCEWGLFVFLGGNPQNKWFRFGFP
ncbi:unnamed protein product [Effrenium voratum]|nr:unnamed protein product [Effrenium voratum]